MVDIHRLVFKNWIKSWLPRGKKLRIEPWECLKLRVIKDTWKVKSASLVYKGLLLSTNTAVYLHATVVPQSTSTYDRDTSTYCSWLNVFLSLFFVLGEEMKQDRF